MSNDNAYAENTPLTRLFGSKPRIKILSVLLAEKESDINVSDIARLAGTARSTVYDHLTPLQELGVVEQTREVGGSPMYQLDTDHPIVHRLREIEGLTLRLSLAVLDDETAEEMKEAVEKSKGAGRAASNDIPAIDGESNE